MKKFALLTVMALLTLRSLSGAETPPLLLVLEVRGLQNLAAEVENVAAHLELPVGKEDVLKQLGGMLMTPDLAGLDLAGTVRVFVFQKTEPSASPLPPVVLSLPVTDDGQAYLDALGAALKPGGEVEGMEHFQADPAVPAPGPLQDVFVLRMDKRLLAGPDRVLVRDAAEDLHEGRLSDAILPVSGTLAFSVACRRNVVALESLADQWIASPKNIGGEQPMDVARVLRAELTGVLRLLRQVEQVMVGVKADSGRLSLAGRLEAAPGSVLERVFGEMRPPSEEFFTLLPDGALFADTGFVVVPDEFLDAYLEMTEEMYAAMGPPWDKLTAPLRETVEAIRGQIIGDYAIGLVPGAGNLPVNMVQVAAVRDPERVKKAMDQMIRALQEVIAGDPESPVGMKLDIGEPREYEGVSITPYHYAMKIPENEAQQMPPFLTGWLKEMTFELAFVDQKMLYTWGPESVMNQLIDRVRRPGAPIHQTTFCRSLLPDLPGAAVRVNWFRLMEVVRAFVRAVPDAPAGLIEALPATPVTVAGYSVVEGNSYVSTARLALSDLAEVARFFTNLASQFGPAAFPAPSEEPILEEDVEVEEAPAQELEEEPWPQ